MAQAYVERRKVIITGGTPYAIDISGNSKVGLVTSGTWQGSSVAISYGGTGANNASDARSNLGLSIGSNVQAYSSTLDAVANGSYTGSSSITTLGTVSTGTWQGSVVGVTYGGTGANNASDARSNLGVAIGTNVQAYSSTLDAVANGSYTGSSSITTLGTVSTGTWQGSAVGVTYGGTGANNASDARTNLGVAIGTNVQAYSSTLDAVANGSYTGSSSITTLGTVSTGTWQGSVVGVTYGGTGANNAPDARTNLGLGTIATQDASNVSVTDITVSGNLIVNGTTTTINSTELSVDDKNITLGDTNSPSDATADGGGITLKGTTDKTFNWVDSTDSWTSSEHLNLASGKELKINGTSVLNGSTLGSGVTSSSLTSVGTISTGTWQGSVVGVTYGGTGANNASDARTNLGVAIGTNVQAYSSTLDAVANGSYTGSSSITTLGTVSTGTWQGSVVGVTYGGTGANNASDARTNLGVAIGTNVQAYSSTLDAVANGSYTGSSSITTLGTVSTGTWQGSVVGVTYGGTGANNASDARTNLGVAIGTNVQAYSSTLDAVANGSYTGSSSITTLGTVSTGTWQGSVVGVTYGGTGANNASDARTNLGVAIGTNVQAYSSTLDAVANGSYTGSSSITTLGTVSTGTWQGSVVGVTYGGTGANNASDARTNLGLGIGSNVQAYSSTLDAVANGSYTGSSSITTLGTVSTGTWQGSVVGVTYGGTGANNAPDARTNLGLGTIATQDASNVSVTDITVSGNLIVNGTTTTINSTELSVDDKNITLGDTNSPSDATADGGGITLKGTTDKTFNWVDSTDSWTSSEHLNLASGKELKINGTSVLSGTTLGSGVTSSSLTSVGTISTGTWQGSVVGVTYGGTGANNASDARTNLGLGIGSNVQAYSSTLDAVANGSYTGSSSITTLGTVSTGTWQGSVVGVTYGGTGANNASDARTNLGLGIGSNVQAYSSTLDAVANGSYTGSSSITTLGTVSTGTWQGSVVGVTYGGTGANNAPDARTNLGLGTIATQDASNVSVTGGTLSGITNLSISGVFNAGLTLATNAYSNAKISVRTPLISFKTVAETNLFTVPAGYMFLIDSMEVLTTSITTPGSAPDVRFGNTGDSSAYYSAETSLSNSVGSRHVIDIPQDGVAENTVVTFGVTSASTASAHSGCGIVTGYLIKL